MTSKPPSLSFRNAIAFSMIQGEVAPVPSEQWEAALDALALLQALHERGALPLGLEPQVAAILAHFNSKSEAPTT